jgi:hypothetical protein
MNEEFTSPSVDLVAGSRRAKLMLAAQSSCDVRTVERWLRGESVKALCAERLRDAALALRIQLPGGVK